LPFKLRGLRPNGVVEGLGLRSAGHRQAHGVV